MIWLLIIAAIIVISFILALRSMKNYQEIPPQRYPYGVFLLQNPNQLQNDMLAKLYDFCTQANAIISLEKLFKGPQNAIVLFAPQNILQYIPELELLEIEDYLTKDGRPDGPKKASVDEVILWSLLPKNESELPVPQSFLENILLEDTQQLFWQLVLAAHKRVQHFQVNIRVMVVDSDVHKRIELAKKVENYIRDNLKLTKKEANQSMAALYISYQKRALIPSEIEGFVLSTQKIKELIS